MALSARDKMYRAFDPKPYWQSKPWCSICGQRKVRYGTICHQCLAKSRADRNEVKPTSDKTPAKPPVEIKVDIPGLREAVDRKLQLWKERLINLSLRNRLLTP